MSKLLIVGNGFDLNIGLKTTYHDFLESFEFRSLLSGVIIESDNSLANFINNHRNNTDWVDVENLLKKYAKEHAFGKLSNPRKYSLKKFNREFVLLKETLSLYLTRAQSAFTESTNCQALQLIRDGSLTENYRKPFKEIVTFNYTDSIEKFYLDRNRPVNGVFHIHGSLAKKNIVFGVEDGAVDFEFAFLNKSDHAYFGKVSLTNKFQSCTEIHFFGCALGDTDDTHFEPAFEVLNQEINYFKTLIFYVFGREGYQNLRTNLLRHTKNKLGLLKSNHKVHFYDLQTDKEIDQEWLNNLGGE